MWVKEIFWGEGESCDRSPGDCKRGLDTFALKESYRKIGYLAMGTIQVPLGETQKALLDGNGSQP